MEEPNGLTKGRPSTRLGNGKAAMPSRKIGAPAARSWRSRLFNTIARLLTWYAIITILFRCPSTLEECDETSPVLCKAYFNTRDVVLPHVEPYYDTYAAPYVDKARPYVDTVSTRVIAPTRVVLERYAAPKLEQAKEFAQAHWATTGQPQVDKARELVAENYAQNVAPHVEKISQAIGPYRDIAQASAMETYHDVILPSYEFVKPYAVSAYDVGCTVTTETVVPSVVYAFNKTYVFLDGNVWPHLRAVYVQSVEPQLVRIGERLGRYKDSGNNSTAKKNVPTSHSSDDAEESSFVKPSESVSVTASEADKRDATTSTTTETISSADAIPSSAGVSDVEAQEKPTEKLSREEVRRIASETVEEDLQQWETKFATAAEEGANDIEEKVNELSADMYESGVQGEGEGLVRELESASQEQIEALKQEIIRIVETWTSGDAAEAKEAANAAVRAVGLAIKEKAEEVRSWREEFEFELRATVTSKAQEHFNILGSMRDLALQKLGMKWAWMDGVTYKDWAKYHAMKKKFDEWTQELQQLIVTNPSLETAMNGAADVEDRAMEIAQNAAIQLGQLKQVAAWKIDAGDVTDNFDADEMEQAAEAALGAAASTNPSEESQIAHENVNDADVQSEPVASDRSSAGDDEEVRADTAPEVEPEEEPEPQEEDGTDVDDNVHGNEDADPPEPAAAEPDMSEEVKEAPVAEAEGPGSEAQTADDGPAEESPESVHSEPEPSLEPEEQADTNNQEAAPSVEGSDEAAYGEEPDHVILGASAEMVLPEDATAGAAEGLERASEMATADAEYLHSEILHEASYILSQAKSSISEQLEATPQVDAEDLVSSASSAFSASVESAESELSSAYEMADSMLEGEETSVAKDQPVDAETSTAEEQSVETQTSTAEEEPEAIELETPLANEEDEGSDEAQASVVDEQPEVEAAAADQGSEEEGAQEATLDEESLLWEDDAAASEGQERDERDEL